MRPTEAVRLVAIVGELCPGQKISEHTAEAWELVLDDVDYAEAQAALRTVYRDAPQELGYRRVEAADVLREVRRVRRERLASFDPEALVPPAGLSVREELEWGRAARRAVARGLPVPVGDRGVLKQRDMKELLTGQSRKI